ncbi:MAG: FAD-dependent oxidoreductase [Opitutales bacterium]|nr:FAD-dependent oxidoreductase [Opitutales bacterium]
MSENPFPVAPGSRPLPGAAPDVVVHGATLGGIGAALALAGRGLQVLLLEGRTFPAADCFATLDYGLSEDRLKELAGAIGLSPSALAHDNGKGLHPRRTKSALEDRLLDAGVDLLYLMRPVAWRSADDGRLQLELAGKSGPWMVETARFVDATMSGDFVSAFAEPVRPARGDVTRRIELARVDTAALDEGSAIRLPDGTAFRWIDGPYDGGHGFVVVPMERPWSGEAEDFARAEHDAAALLHAVRDRLKAEHRAFAKAKVCGLSSVECGEPARRFGSHEGHAHRVLPGVWMAGTASAIDGASLDERLCSPAERFAHGQRVGKDVADAPGDRVRGGASGSLPLRRVDTDVLVAGGGTSGASAAMGAGEAGARVVVADANAGLGGVGTAGGINSYWFGRRGGHNQRLSQSLARQGGYDARPPEKPEDIRQWNPDGKARLLAGMADASGAAVFTQAVLVSPLLSGNRVTGAVFADPAGLIEVCAKVTVDATGDGDLAAAAGVPYTYGAEDTGATMWFALVPVSKPGNPSSQFTSWVDVRCPRDLTRAILSGRRREFKPDRNTAWDHAQQLSTRESRHIHGEVVLTLTDQLRQRHWDDAVAVTFSNHDVKGYTESEWIRFGLIPPNLEIEVPYRALVPIAVEGLLVTGKALSAIAEALPAVRMQPDLENLGYATGMAAARCASGGIEPRRFDARTLRDNLLQKGILPRNEPPSETAHTPEQLRAWIAELHDETGLRAYQDMAMNDVHHGPISFVELCCADEAVIPLLLEELADADSPRRVTVALALAWHRRAEAASVLLGELERRLKETTGLPPSEKAVRYTQPPPDQGNFPECVCYLYALARCGAREALPMVDAFARRVEATEEDLRSTKSGLFDYVDAICRLAEVLAGPTCVPALLHLLRQPLWHESVFTGPHQADWFMERKAFLELRIARALARCGADEGTRTLQAFLQDSRKPLANFARRALGN